MLDADSDGKVSYAELGDFADRMREASQKREAERALLMFDRDGDGSVSKEEFNAYVIRGGEKPAAGNSGDSKDANKARIHGDYAEDLFRVADANGDGVLQAQEFQSLYHTEGSTAMMELAGKAAVKRYDQNGDGVVTPPEFAAREGGPDEGEQHFRQLDADGNDQLDSAELAHEATGRSRTWQDLSHLVRSTDADGDGQVSLEELRRRRGDFVETPGGFHLQGWATHLDL